MPRVLSLGGFAAGVGLLAAAAVTPVWGETLRDALESAYLTNPTLEAARAQQRAVDESVPIEKSAGRPFVSSQATYAETLRKSSNAFTSPDRVLSADVNASIPIYSGGAVRNAVNAAEVRVDAGRADLLSIEASVFTQVVIAYMDVMLGEAVVGLNRNQVEVLGVNLQATSDRFEIGDLTRTDVAQSRARLALALGDARAAEADLVGAREMYIQVVGRPPDDLEPPPPLPNLPASPQEAVAAALEYNPEIIAARERVEAAGYDIEVAGATRLPTIDLFTTGGYQDYFGTLGGGTVGPGVFAQSETTAQAGARVTLPIYQGGLPAALRRQAQALAASALDTAIAVERDVIARTRAAYSSWIASQEVIESTQIAVEAAELSLEGVRAENTVGNRTILDILNAEQELLQARVQLVTARRNAYVAGFALLAATGRADARDLNLAGGALYNPVLNYERVRGKWFDWENDPPPTVRSTRTVDTPLQDGEVEPSELSQQGWIDAPGR